MKGKKFIIRVLAIIMIGTGFLSVQKVVAGELSKPQPPTAKWVEVAFSGGGTAKYKVNPSNGCIDKFIDREGDIPEAKKPPDWLVPGSKMVDFGSFSNPQCREGVIAIGGSPIEYWAYANGSWFCVGAFDPCNGRWYPRCTGYEPCP